MVLLNIKDDKADFVMELLRSFKFIKAEKITSEKAKLIKDIKEAVEEMKLIKAGKLKGRPAEELLDEL